MSATKASRNEESWSNQIIRKPPVPWPGDSRAASEAIQNLFRQTGNKWNVRFGRVRMMASSTAKHASISVVKAVPFSYCLSLMAASPPHPTLP